MALLTVPADGDSTYALREAREAVIYRAGLEHSVRSGIAPVPSDESLLRAASPHQVEEIEIAGDARGADTCITIYGTGKHQSMGVHTGKTIVISANRKPVWPVLRTSASTSFRGASKEAYGIQYALDPDSME